jgi:hypothetical protein
MAYQPRYNANHPQGQQQSPSLVRYVVNNDYRGQYEGVGRSFVPQRGRGGRRVAPARRAYNTKRTDQLRFERGKEAMKQVT